MCICFSYLSEGIDICFVVVLLIFVKYAFPQLFAFEYLCPCILGMSPINSTWLDFLNHPIASLFLLTTEFSPPIYVVIMDILGLVSLIF